MKTYSPNEFAVLLDKHEARMQRECYELEHDTANELQDRARALAPKQSGFLVENIAQSDEPDGVHVGVLKTAGQHANVLFGTGIYGAARHVIRTEIHPGMPMGNIGGHTIFRRFQRGTPVNMFWEEAVTSTLSGLRERMTLFGQRVADIEE